MSFKSYTATVLDELSNTLTQVDQNAVDRIVESITTVPRTFVSGAGRSGLMMQGFAMRLMHLGFDIGVTGEIATPGIEATDLLLIGSGSGATASLVNHAKTAKQIGATVGLFTIQADAPIGKLADMVLTLPAPTPKIKQDLGFQSIQPMGALFEQSLLLTLEVLILILMEKTGQTSEQMFGRHANLE